MVSSPVVRARWKVEGERDLGDEAEHGGRVEGDADAPVGELGLFGGRQAVEVEEFAGDLGADGTQDALHQVEVAEAVLEADDAVGAGEFDDRGGGEHRVVALVDDNGQRGRRGHLAVVPQQPLLPGDHQIRRHGEQPVRPGVLREPRVPYGEGGAVARARDHRHPARGRLHGRPDARLELLGQQRVELPGAAAREHGGGPGLDAPADMRAVDVEIDGAVGAVRGDGEEQRPAGDTEPVGERGWRHGLSLEQARTFF